MQTIGTSIWKIDSGKSGPRLMILGGVHGNELTGIEVVNRLVSRRATGELNLVCGSLTLALGNPRAIEKGERGSVPHADMNRVFLKEKIGNPSDYEEFRASELAPFMAASDVLIDIHSTNKPSRPFSVAKDGRPARIALARLFPADDFLISPPEIIDGTTDVWVTAHGGIGLGYESGITSDLAKVPETLESVERVLAHLGMTESAPPHTSQNTLRVSRLQEAVTMPDEGFEFAEGRGEGSFEPFRKGDAIGFAGNRPVLAGYNGLLMFPKIPEHRKTGSPVCFLATEAV